MFLRLGGSLVELPVLKEWDTNGDGVISEEELVAAAMSHSNLQNKVRNYRQLLAFGAGILVLSLGVMIAAVIIGIESTRTTKVDGGRLTTIGGSTVGTNQAYNFQQILDLFLVTRQNLHEIQFVTFWVPTTDTMVYFKVETIERNATDLLLISPSLDLLDISATAAYFQRSSGERYFITGTTSGPGRRLVQTSSGNGLSGTTSSSNGTAQPNCCLPGPCCP